MFIYFLFACGPGFICLYLLLLFTSLLFGSLNCFRQKTYFALAINFFLFVFLMSVE